MPLEHATSYEQAVEFHRALGLPVGDAPAPITDDRLRLRLTLLAEEVAELVCAMCGIGPINTAHLAKQLNRAFLDHARLGAGGTDLAAIAKELIDVHVVTSGTAVEYGIPEDDVAAEVHRSNMAKAGGPRREDGKVLKPADWTPPDVDGVLAGVVRRAA